MTPRADGQQPAFAPIRVRPATCGDGPGLAVLMAEMERHYEGANAIETAIAAERLRAHWPRSDGALMLVAFAGDDPDAAIVGLATLFRLFPGRAVQPSCWLKELYVAKAARGQGVGASLMRACAGHVRGMGATRLDWTTATANGGARRFYEGLGGFALDAVVYRLEGAALDRLAVEAPARTDASDSDPDSDIDEMTPEALRSALRHARAAIRTHRDATGHDLCWHHPDLWALLPERIAPTVAVPPWPQFLRGCVAYRASLDRELPDAPVHGNEYRNDR
jgi:GNAT superfamily N-acetyltransferase